MLIKVVRWEEHQGRRDHVHPTWFKFSHRIMLSAEDLVIGRNELVAWIYVLCLCNEANKDAVLLSRQHHNVFGRQDWKEFNDSLLILQQLQWIKIEQKNEGQLSFVPALDPHSRTREELEEKRDKDSKESEKQLPRIAILWNENTAEELSRVKECGPSRMKLCKARWKEHPKDEYWLEVFQKINESSFLLGKIEGKPWKAKFDWLIRPDTAIKILEGQYADRGQQTKKLNPFQEKFNAHQK